MARDYQSVQWELFVVRLARETGIRGWRGQIVHLPDRQTKYLASWADVRSFINQYVPEEMARPWPDEDES
jgi:hypothetical protein